ncbi:SseB family protein [Streptomyces stramineus]|uniref:SseB protein N-terminal domain-containing protein n=1 Tax=Streptomyces stramineus TaxID=173861 RepID=A0ABN1A309_9ACTN
MSLTDEVVALHAGRPHPAALVGEFRRAAVLVPLDERGGLLTVSFGGVWWVHAFTDEAALARFTGGAGAEYLTVLGARLLDVVVPGVGEPAGVALDVGGERPALFPPVAGIVPDAATVDAATVDAAVSDAAVSDVAGGRP